MLLFGKNFSFIVNQVDKMENAEEIFHFLEEFSKRKPKTIPQELNEYLAYVARTGDPVYQWSLVKSLFKEKLLSVITDFHETTPGIDIPPYPNVDPFNYDVMKNGLLERLDSFTSAPFTVQRICELLTYPRKQYNRIDKYMRAIEKNILVVSTREPGIQRHAEPENGEPMEPVVNGSDNNSEYNVDVEMEDMSWKENADQRQSSEPQPSSSDAHISIDNIEARLKLKNNTPMDTNKIVKEYESVTPPELNLTPDQPMDSKPSESESVPVSSPPQATTSSAEPIDNKPDLSKSEDTKTDVEMKPEITTASMVIPEIKIDDAEMTEQRLSEKSSDLENENTALKTPANETICPEYKPLEPQATPVNNSDENSSDSITKEETEPKLISEVSTSSEESSSSSDNTDGNSNSPKHSNCHIDIQEESNQSDFNSETGTKPDEPQQQKQETEVNDTPKISIQSDNYSITDVNSELPQPPTEVKTTVETEKEHIVEKEEETEKPKADISAISEESSENKTV